MNNNLKGALIAAIGGIVIGLFSKFTKTTIIGPHWAPEIILTGLYMFFGYWALKKIEDGKEK